MPQAIGGPATGRESRQGRKSLEEAAARAKSLIELDDVDSTLYFLDEAEISYLARELEEEYQRDVRGSASQHSVRSVGDPVQTADVRDEILRVLEQLFPNLLNSRDFPQCRRGAPRIQAAEGPSGQLQPEQTQRLEGS